MGRRKKQGPIADREEVLAVITSIMRGEMTEEAIRKVAGGEERIAVPPKISERCKAAELMGKELGIFEKKEEQPADGTDLTVLRLLAEMHERADKGSV